MADSLYIRCVKSMIPSISSEVINVFYCMKQSFYYYILMEYRLFALRYCQTLHYNYNDLLQEKSNQSKINTD